MKEKQYRTTIHYDGVHGGILDLVPASNNQGVCLTIGRESIVLSFDQWNSLRYDHYFIPEEKENESPTS